MKEESKTKTQLFQELADLRRRVADLARSIGQEMGLPEDQVDGLRMAGIVHDLGKVALPAEILSKPNRLSDIEFSLIKVHPQISCDILKDIDFPFTGLTGWHIGSMSLWKRSPRTEGNFMIRRQWRPF